MDFELHGNATLKLIDDEEVLSFGDGIGKRFLFTDIFLGKLA